LPTQCETAGTIRTYFQELFITFRRDDTQAWYLSLTGRTLTRYEYHLS